eukprot:TRINITY_DN1201_c0_g1_i3.p1 TRINITY_DN1201_c0_g1~~TRINITY_DN1201_c0_g1_i3.p1  ORF type:complete len:407 (+),score=106.78 TRINITY_DN1201_c0_g1_i3:122-1342(+)
MGGYFSRHDPDDVFSYNTIKIVTIRDRYLGVLHHGFQIGIFIYIVIYVIFIQLAFLDKQPAYGAIRLALLSPSSGYSVSPYCSATPNLSFPQKLPCIAHDKDKGISGAGQGNLFITTHLTLTEYSANCTAGAVCDVSHEDATIISGPSEFFTQNVEDHIISIDHSPISVDLGLSLEGELEGQLQYQKSSDVGGHTWEQYNGITYNSLAADHLKVGDLLGAANMKDLDVLANEYLVGKNVSAHETFRYYGMDVLLILNYDNTRFELYWLNVRDNTNNMEYQYRPYPIVKLDDFLEETVYIHYPDRWVQVERRGIRITTQVTGTLGGFAFQTLLIQLTTALALMRLATTLVDMAAIHVLPRKLLYKGAKYQLTEDFSDLMAAKKRDAEEEKKRSNGANTDNEMHTISI